MDLPFYLYIYFAFLVLLLLIIIFIPNKEADKYQKKLKESLKEEYIIDQETGAKLTLEEAESGIWLDHDNEFRTISEMELNKIPTNERKQVEVALNYLRESRFFRKTKLNAFEVKQLEKTKILGGYDDWSYSDTYKFENGFVFLPSVEWNKEELYQETHFMLWLKIQNIEGHYLFREKTSSEKFFDLIRSDDDIKLKDYECFTVKKSRNIIKINTILNKIIPNKSIEIEMNNDNLFIKTLKLVNLEDVKRMESIINKFR